MKFYVSYSFEVELPEEFTDSMPEDRAKEIATELVQHINFQELQHAYARRNTIAAQVVIKRIRSVRIEEW